MLNYISCWIITLSNIYPWICLYVQEEEDVAHVIALSISQPGGGWWFMSSDKVQRLRITNLDIDDDDVDFLFNEEKNEVEEMPHMGHM